MNALPRLVPLAVALALLAPAAAAGPALLVRSVGEIFVDASGHATGLNLAADITETDGLLRSFRAEALGRDVFAEVRVDGFEQAAKIQGVGSALVSLKGKNAEILLHDNINSILKVKASQATTVRYALAEGIELRATDGSRAVVDLHADGAYIGSIVAVGGDGPDARGDRIHVIKDEAHARIRAGSQVVFVARPVYADGDAYPRAIVEALAEGDLAASYVTELDGGAIAASQVEYGAARVSTIAEAGSVRSTIEAKGRAQLLSYDLAYETLPARASEDVSVYIDGELAQRAQSGAEVLANLRGGLASYYVALDDGRAQVLASTPGFDDAREHVITIAAAQAATEAQARAEARSEGGSRVLGDFAYSSGGKLLGAFVTAVVPEGSSELRSYTSLASRATVFGSVSVEENGQATFQTGGHRLVLDGAKADITLVDDAYATLLVEADAPSRASLQLGDGVRARSIAEGVLAIEGPSGRLGLLMGPGLRASSEGDVRADLAEGERIIFRSVTSRFGSEDAVASAIADGRVGAQILAGHQAGAYETSYVAYAHEVTTEARASGERIIVEYASASADAQSLVLDARGSALHAKSAGDIRVLVDGQPIPVAASAKQALSSSTKARYFAETSAEGGLRVIVNAAKPAGAQALVTIESRLDAAARAAKGTDDFGAFKVFYDGTAVGSFVRFRGDQSAGAISDFGLLADGRAVFSSLVAGGSPFVTTGLDGATTLVLENREARLEVSDTTSGILKVAAKERTHASFRLADGLKLVERSDRVLEVRDGAGAHLGSLVATGGTLDASGGSIRASLQEGGSAIWRAHVGLEQELSDAQRSMLNEAIASGGIAGQVVARAPAGEGALEASSSSVVDAVTTQFGDVRMTTAAARDRVEVTLSSESPVGKTLLITLDPRTVPSLAEGDAVVLFDGLPIGEADSFADVLDANDDGGIAEYLVLAGESGTQVLVSVPHFSVHTVTLKEAPDGKAAPLLVYATIALGALAVVEGIVLVARRKNA